MSKLGTFIWHDLMTTDLATSKYFYTQLFSWTAPTHEGGGVTYTEISAAGRPQGGMMALDPSHGAPSHWMPYVLVENVDKTCGRAGDLGGKLLVPPQDIPKVGRFAVLEDPTGAVFAPFTYVPDHPQKPEDAAEMPAPGRFCWDELMSSDPDKAANFYQTLLGWHFEPMDMGGGQKYWIGNTGGRQVCGLMQKDPMVPRSFWLAYVAVADVDAKSREARELGAQQYVPPTDIPNIGRFAVLGDPTGATFALFRSSR